jgi:hypothetical protein
MALLHELIPAVRGRPAVIMGGSPSLPEDVAKVQGDAVWFSANHHGAMLRGADYVVYVDPTHQVTGEPMQEKLSAYGAPTISPCFGADYRVPNWDSYKFRGNCGMQAIWFAAMLGANPIIVCGMECYQSGVYWHDEAAKSSSAGRPQSFFEGRLSDLKRLVVGANVRAVTPSLQKHFPAYDPSESVPPSTATLAVEEPEFETRLVFPARIGKTKIRPHVRVMLTPSERNYFRRYLRR